MLKEILNKADLYKKEIDKLRPFESDLLKQIKAYYRIGLTWTSNAIEGNTLTERETKVLLEDGLTVGGKPLKDTFEAIGHSRAYDFMFSLLHNSTIDENDVLTMHRLFYSNISPNEAGMYRTKQVFITGSRYPVTDVQKIQNDMNRLFEWVKKERKNYHPIEFSALLHKKLVFIHPFIDGNGRVSRLCMNAALIQDGYLIAIIPPVLRSEYSNLLEYAHKDDKKFIEFIAERVIESEREIMRLLHIPLPKIQEPKKDYTPDYLKPPIKKKNHTL